MLTELVLQVPEHHLWEFSVVQFPISIQVGLDKRLIRRKRLLSPLSWSHHSNPPVPSFTVSISTPHPLSLDHLCLPFVIFRITFSISPSFSLLLLWMVDLFQQLFCLLKAQLIVSIAHNHLHTNLTVIHFNLCTINLRWSSAWQKLCFLFGLLILQYTQLNYYCHAYWCGTMWAILSNSS